MTNIVLMPSSSKHVFLIDDDASMLASLTGILEFIGYKVYAFASAIEFLKMPLQVAPAVVIADMRMPDMTGVELQAELLKRGRQIPIIFISGQSTTPQAILAMKQGAIEFLIKPFERDELLAAVVHGLEIDTTNMRSHIDQIAFEEMVKNLSTRQLETFDLLAQGLNNAELMERLNVTLATAKQYKAEVMRKLSLRSMSQLLSLKRGQFKK